MPKIVNAALRAKAIKIWPRRTSRPRPGLNDYIIIAFRSFRAQFGPSKMLTSILSRLLLANDISEKLTMTRNSPDAERPRDVSCRWIFC